MRSENSPWWRRNKKLLMIMIILCIVIASFLYLSYWFKWSWTGFNEFTGPNIQQYQPTKTLWDWMQLLIVPAVLAIAAFLLNFATSKNEREETKQRAETEREIALDSQRETLLQTYLDRMSDLLLNNHLREPDPKATEVRDIARARTLTVLAGLDPVRKGNLIRFLYDSKLIITDTDIKECIVDLSEANLNGADLTRANLIGANLSGADLSGATLRFARLDTACLVSANLSEANLTGAHLNDANLMTAKLGGAKLRGTNLKRVRLNDADLRTADLYRANMNRADLSGANLSKSDLTDAILDEIIITNETSLDGAEFSEEQKEALKNEKKFL